ncbi:metalloregulator ArsR/SmtB family transcription factor [Agromyces sp. Marseille-P2726]|uniref:helix-turn-helix transcriptional regulator n=1 Tax=Agromyces sp. Marseille-P2726 TaxID=2709132 RepID=UPI00156F3E2A|nr:helix-turn-helix domain-containing protein [Agromyces sp. Marseille-P2726]
MDEVEEVRPPDSAGGPQQATLSRLLALGDPVRRRVYDVVARGTEPMSRDAVAAECDLSRSTAAFHLERLATDGLLVTESRRLSGRTGPGAGRPAKLYRRADDEFAVSVPDRQYRLAGEVLATAIEESHETGEPAREAVRRVAGQTGERLGRESPSLARALEVQGYEPRADGTDVIMGNCPFHRLAAEHPSLVCELNVELVRGAARGSGEACRVDLDPGAGGCCIRISSD